MNESHRAGIVPRESAESEGGLTLRNGIYDELCLISAGMPVVRHAGSEIRGEAGTLFLFTQGEAHGVWDVGTTVARFWSLEFRIHSQVGPNSTTYLSARLNGECSSFPPTNNSDFAIPAKKSPLRKSPCRKEVLPRSPYNSCVCLACFATDRCCALVAHNASLGQRNHLVGNPGMEGRIVPVHLKSVPA